MSIFENLFVFEMANNHQGSVEHGLRIIREMGAITQKYNLNATVKLQYRNLDTFIHPIKRKDKTIHYIQRFLSTELKKDAFAIFLAEIKKQGMRTMVTPFDEDSVDWIMEQDVDIIKVASCSADDWPLLEKIAKTGKPVLASTGGVELMDIDNLVSFFTHRVKECAFMHCVSIYPTPGEMTHIGFIKKLRNRYPGVLIGWSGHEGPDNVLVSQLALANGAKMLERHVGVPTEESKLNAYSMNPGQVENWVKATIEAKATLGDGEKYVTKTEADSLLALKRGLFVKKDVKKGDKLTDENTYFAFPAEAEQVTSGDFGKLRANYIATKNYRQDDAIFETTEPDTYHQIRQIIHTAKGMLAEANVILSDDAQIELSHHYGIARFAEFGCVLVSLVNREYCKKIIVAFPNQSHPEQYHVKKEETFHVLAGDLELSLNGIVHKMGKGDIKTLERGVRHSFISRNGCIFEEVSTTHFRNDSFYLDPAIDQQDPLQRKTLIEEF